MARGLQKATVHRQRNPSIHQPICDMVDILMAELTKRLGGIEQVNLFADATLLDPRFKKHAFVQDKYAEEAVSRVVGAASREARSLPPATPSTEGEEANPPVSPPTESLPAIWADFEEQVSSLRPGVQTP